MNQSTRKQRYGLTRKDLVREVPCPPYVVQYLTELRRLPLIQESNGPGRPHVYHQDAIKILKDWISRGGG